MKGSLERTDVKNFSAKATSVIFYQTSEFLGKALLL